MKNGVYPYGDLFVVYRFGKMIMFPDKYAADKCYEQLKTGLIYPSDFVCESKESVDEITRVISASTKGQPA